MKKFTRVLVFITFAVFLMASSAHAVPFLQLDIEGGYYVGPPEETITAPDYAFTLYALVNSSSKKYEGPSGFFISAALVQIAQDADPQGGSFSFNSDTVYVSDMAWGVAPLGLPSHGIFPTNWAEFPFLFGEDQTAASYNSQDSPGGLVRDDDGPLLYAAFKVDTSNVAVGYAIHFDLYDYGSGVENFAPFSHDAQSFPIPEPATMLLLGCGLLGLGVVGKKKFLKRV